MLVIRLDSARLSVCSPFLKQNISTYIYIYYTYILYIIYIYIYIHSKTIMNEELNELPCRKTNFKQINVRLLQKVASIV